MSGGPVFLSHPLAQSFLTEVRARETSRAIVRHRVRALAMLLFYEATRDLPHVPRPITTPLAETEGTRVAVSVGLVPVLRAGLGMVDGILELLPEARVFHLGIFRDERTLTPVEYYSKLAEHSPVDVAFILDPMLATGGSAVAAASRLKAWGVPRIKFLGLIAAPEGLRRLTEAHPDVEIFLCALDSHLNEKGFIVPGMGDAGDRQFSGA
ncbi:MAG: uracil phosphoribosyltransferase [Verrucomicrobiae bacterium]|nr:uracil phosphoribosyltransferase [Verrucomicrobiae bacterium]